MRLQNLLNYRFSHVERNYRLYTNSITDPYEILNYVFYSPIFTPSTTNTSLLLSFLGTVRKNEVPSEHYIHFLKNHKKFFTHLIYFNSPDHRSLDYKGTRIRPTKKGDYFRRVQVNVF